MDMQETLNSVYLKLDINMQYLTSKAIAQIIVKIVYQQGCSMTVGEIKSELAKLNEGNRFSDSEIDEIISDLGNNELKQRDGRYYLSTSRRNKMKQAAEESEKRLNNIIKKYFSGLNSSEIALREWLSTVTRVFFETYSNEWVSDLNNHTNYISQSAESIRLQVMRRTEAMKDIDKDDKKELHVRFFDFVNSRDSDVDEYLWGYGTSAFASKLIRSKYGIDKLTMEAFRDSVCVLDTNVLLFIALESKYADSFNALEKVFRNLNIQPKYFYITKREYENKVCNQRKVTLSNYNRFGFETISKFKDDFMQSALRLGCRTSHDFEQFFDTALSIPQQIFQSVDICLLDDDTKINEAIDRAQQNEELKAKLNRQFKDIVGRDKSPSACMHDIGLLEGVQYLRNRDKGEQNKYFILSDEISVNQYSKGLGLKQNLPLSLRVDTLINLLAVNNGGDNFDAADYKPLFANIIRMGLTPRKETFNQEELYELSEMNEKLASLPAERVYDIAMQMHRKRLSGENEADLRRDLHVLVTRGKLEVKDELRDMQDQLAFKSQEKQRLSDELEFVKNATRIQVEKDYDRKTKKMVGGCIGGVVVLVILVLVGVEFAINFQNQANNLIINIISGIIGSAIISVVGAVWTKKKIINTRKGKREVAIENEVKRRLYRE